MDNKPQTKQSELKIEMMNRKQLQNQFDMLRKSASPYGPTPEHTQFIEKAIKNPNWKYIK